MIPNDYDGAFLKNKSTSKQLFCKNAPSQIFQKDLNEALGKAKYLPQMQMQVFKKGTVPDTDCFFTNIYWKTILSKTA